MAIQSDVFVLWPAWRNSDKAFLQRNFPDATLLIVTAKLGNEDLKISAILTKYMVKEVPYVVYTVDSSKNMPLSDASFIYEAVMLEDAIKRGVEASEMLDFNEALYLFECALIQSPINAVSLFNMASIFHMIEYPTLSIRYIERLLLSHPTDMTAHTFLWALANREDCQSLCIDTYRRLSPSDVVASHKLSVLTGEGNRAVSGDPSYARLIYDEMAERFENKLVDRLSYKGPWILHDMVNAICESDVDSLLGGRRGRWRVLDLGCGSGLGGKVFRHFARPRVLLCDDSEKSPAAIEVAISVDVLEPYTAPQSGGVIAGVDISPRIAAIAAATGDYDVIACANITQALTVYAGKGSLDFVLAADIFIYVGTLGTVFAGVKAALCDHGLFAFSVEDLDDHVTEGRDKNEVECAPPCVSPVESTGDDIAGAVPGWGARLRPSARFAHSEAYIVALANLHGFAVRATSRLLLRLEGTEPVRGIFCVLQRL